MLETYAALTRLRPPHRVGGALVAEYISDAFGGRQLSLDSNYASRLLPELVELGVTGGASYDAVIATIAREHDAELVTLDARARRTYDLVGVRARFIGSSP